MPGYVEKALKEFQQQPTTKPEHQPFRSKEIQYRIPTQMTDPIDSSPSLTKDGILQIHLITGTFLYYARAVDPTMLVTLSALASQQAKATEQTAMDVVNS